MNKEKPQKKLKEGEDYYLNDQGLLVLTKEFLIKRGFCCHNSCTNCPYKKDSNPPKSMIKTA